MRTAICWTAYRRVCDLEETAAPATAQSAPPARNTMTQWEPVGFVKLMGIKVIKRSPEGSEAELYIRDELCNRRGVMHGGAVMGWADTMGGMTASAALAGNQVTATIESKTNFFAPIPKGDTARALPAVAHGPHHNRAADRHYPRRRPPRCDGDPDPDRTAGKAAPRLIKIDRE